MDTNRAVVAVALAVSLVTACTDRQPQPTPSEDTTVDPAAEPTQGAETPTQAAASVVEVVGDARPTIRWPAVDGAASYRVTVLQDDGPAWAWEGEQTEVVLGGGDQDGGGLGFRLTSSAVVTVTAHGVDGAVLRLDQRRVDAPQE